MNQVTMFAQIPQHARLILHDRHLIVLIVAGVVSVTVGFLFPLVNPIFALAFILATPVWVLLFMRYELALAIHLAGFQFYPFLTSQLGINTTPTLTVAFYAFITTGYIFGALYQERDSLFLVLGHRTTKLFAVLCGWMFHKLAFAFVWQHGSYAPQRPYAFSNYRALFWRCIP